MDLTQLLTPEKRKTQQSTHSKRVPVNRGVEFAPVCTPVRCPRCRNENFACDAVNRSLPRGPSGATLRKGPTTAVPRPGRFRHRAKAAHDDLATKPVASDDDLESCYDDVTAACVDSRCALPLDWCSSCSPVRPSSLCTP